MRFRMPHNFGTWTFFIAAILTIVFIFIRAYRRSKKTTISSNDTVLITGGCLGVGFALASQIAQRFKCKIVIWDIREELFLAVKKTLEELGSQVHMFKCDVSVKSDIYKTLAETLAKTQTIDFLINNAGVVNGKSFDNLSNEEVERTMNVNFMGPVWITKEVLSLMKSNGKGHIITMSSSAGHIYSCDSADYCASKAASFAFFSSLRLELKRSKSPIKTTVICPSGIATGMFEGFQTPPILKPFFPWVAPENAAFWILDGIIHQDEEIYFPFYHQIAFRVLFTLPAFLTDYISLYLTKDAFSKFKGRSYPVRSSSPEKKYN